MANATLEKMVDLVPGMPRIEVMFPIQDNDSAIQGLFGTLDTSGYVGTFATTERVAGLILQTVKNTDESHAAARAGYDVHVLVDGYIRWYISGATFADRGRAVFVGADNQTLSFTPRANGYVGRVIHVEAGSTYICWIHMENVGASSFSTWFDLADDAEIAMPDAQAGRIRVAGGAEYGEFHVLASGTVAEVSTTATSSVMVPQAGVISLGKPDAATTSGACNQYDLTGGNGSCANLVQPDYARNVVINFTDGDAGISAFTVTVNGTDADGAVQAEAFVFAGGLDQTGTLAFATITSIVITNLVGAAAADTLDVGYGIIFGAPMHGGDTFAVSKLIVDGANDTVAAESAANGTFTPTTAPNGSKEVICYYTYEMDVVPTVVVTGGGSGSANIDNADTDAKLCVYDAGTGAYVKNRLGATYRIHVEWDGEPLA